MTCANLCPIKSVELYDLNQNKDAEGYLNPSYTLNTTFDADAQVIGGEKKLAEFGITDEKIGYDVFPIYPQTAFVGQDVYEKIVKFDDLYYQIIFSDQEGYQIVVKPKRETVVIV